MRFLPTLLIAYALLSSNFAASAEAEFEVGNGGGFTRQLGKFIQKYQLAVEGVVGVSNFDGTVDVKDAGSFIGGYQLRYGVYMLQTWLNTGVKDPRSEKFIYLHDDLIFKDLEDVKGFEEELKNTAIHPASASFDIEENIPVAGLIRRTIAVGYLVPGVTENTVQFKHYFIVNPWGWQPGDDE